MDWMTSWAEMMNQIIIGHLFTYFNLFPYLVTKAFDFEQKRPSNLA